MYDALYKYARGGEGNCQPPRKNVGNESSSYHRTRKSLRFCDVLAKVDVSASYTFYCKRTDAIIKACIVSKLVMATNRGNRQRELTPSVLSGHVK